MALANRLTFIGEVGWELLIASDFAQDIFDRLMAASQPVLKPAGYHALEHLRSEAGYREFDLDLTPDDTPIEAGLSKTVSLNKSTAFTGKDALLKQADTEFLTKRLVLFKLQPSRPCALGRGSHLS